MFKVYRNPIAFTVCYFFCNLLLARALVFCSRPAALSKKTPAKLLYCEFWELLLLTKQSESSTAGTCLCTVIIIHCKLNGHFRLMDNPLSNSYCTFIFSLSKNTLLVKLFYRFVMNCLEYLILKFRESKAIGFTYFYQFS